MTPDSLATIISLLPPYLTCVADLNALISASRLVRLTTLAHLQPHHLLSILVRSPPVLPAQTHLLSSLISKGLVPWLDSNLQNQNLWRTILSYSPDSIVRLALLYPKIPGSAGFSLGQLQLGETRRTVEMLVDELFDHCVGRAWYAVPDFWDGGRVDAVTLNAEPGAMVYLLAAYGEMFGKVVDEWYDHHARKEVKVARRFGAGNWGDDVGGEGGDSGGRSDRDRGTARFEEDPLPSADLALRMEWVKYTMPDWHVPHGDSLEDGCKVVAEGLREWVDVPLRVGRDTLHWLKHGEAAPEGAPAEASAGGQSAPQRDAGDARDDGDEAAGRSRALRSARPEGAYTIWPAKEEHITCFLHLFHRSPLFDRIATAVRRRAIRIAEARVPAGQSTGASENRAWLAGTSAQSGPGQADGGTIHGEFGTRSYSSQGLTTWKQLLWEDAVYTGGWAGLELLADAWERDEENTKADLRRRRLGEERRVGAAAGRVARDAGPSPTSQLGQPEREQGRYQEERVLRVSGRELQEDRGEGTTEKDRPVREEEIEKGWVKDTHPAYQRLAKIYLALRAMSQEPARLTLRSTVRPDRIVQSYDAVPFLLADLQFAVWDPRMGPTWSIAR